jgi:hypothetical protein
MANQPTEHCGADVAAKAIALFGFMGGCSRLSVDRGNEITGYRPASAAEADVKSRPASTVRPLSKGPLSDELRTIGCVLCSGQKRMAVSASRSTATCARA